MEERVDVRGQLGGGREDWGPWSSPWTPVWGHVSRGVPGQGGSQGRSCILRFCFPGCFSIQGPESVRGPEKGSVTVQCHYKPGWEIYRKWWCRGARWDLCRILIKTTGSEQKVKEDRVSIRDDQRDRVLTVTMEELRRDDAGTYWCGIERTGVDLGTRVKVAIDPGKNFLVYTVSPDAQDWKSEGISPSSPRELDNPDSLTFSHRSPGGNSSEHTSKPANCQQPYRSLLWHPHQEVHGGLRSGAAGPCLTGVAELANGSTVSGHDRPGGAQGSDHSASSHRTHYMLLVFVKVPVLLILVGVVLWLKGPQRVPKEQWEEPSYTNLSSDLLTKDTAP
ncbi:PREDICTED: CMRF35-like molecule 7 [Ceratotherium simum simum]|uniref:CMRF35-like molecule 7 n=1 Tax=Ceratotherium simum simum TaxID=73337 RepID=A0ABM1CZA7_CERSS|nr:PREDICTED: CMRF35-like molecule 7 [Ceratotherium simum simum]